MKRRDAARWLALAAGAAFAPALAPTFVPAAAQDETSEVGAGPPGDTSLRLVGRADLGPDSVRLYGYIAGVIGLGRGAVYGTEEPAESTARFTWTADLPTVAREVRGDVTTFAGDGALSIHLDPAGGASWDDPASFSRGDTLAVYTLSLATAVQRQSPDLGVVVGDGTLTQERAEEFSLDDEPFRLGHPGASLRLRFTGALAGPAASSGQPWPVSFTGSAVVLMPSPVAAQPGATPAAPAEAIGGAACSGWAASTRDRLFSAGERAAAARANPVGDLDAAALDDAAAATEADLASQRSEPIEDADAATNRRVAAALGTYARGLRALAIAVASGDAGAATAAQQTLADGDGLADRALADLVSRHPGCG